jgi:hypothetical protein
MCASTAQLLLRRALLPPLQRRACTRSWLVFDLAQRRGRQARRAPATPGRVSATAARAAAQALVGAARGEPSGAVRRAYAAAAAALARQAPEARVAKLVAEAVGLYTEPGAQPPYPRHSVISPEIP